jgi:hypothetical protein
MPIGPTQERLGPLDPRRVTDQNWRRFVRSHWTQTEILALLTMWSGTWPRSDGVGGIFWACCASTIGPPCGHRSTAREQ